MSKLRANRPRLAPAGPALPSDWPCGVRENRFPVAARRDNLGGMASGEGAEMLTIRHAGVRLCDNLTRRDLLHAGGLGLLGLSLPELLRGRAAAAQGGKRARSC